ncbi:MAG: helix-turn-helix domain-containing protein [Dysgonamonadaceae bacterium]|nr:helix-turn-helix domain-containing protein [Dysgonamonadaceae bacterium]
MDDLGKLIRKAIREEVANAMKETPPILEKEIMNVDEAVEYLRFKGYKICKATLYQHTMKGTINFRRYGQRRLVFTKADLDEFLTKQLNNN